MEVDPNPPKPVVEGFDVAPNPPNPEVEEELVLPKENGILNCYGL